MKKTFSNENQIQEFVVYFFTREFYSKGNKLKDFPPTNGKSDANVDSKE